MKVYLSTYENEGALTEDKIGNLFQDTSYEEDLNDKRF